MTAAATPKGAWRITFLLFLYCRGKRLLGPLALAGHLVVTAIVFLAHLHYTVDVLGAWAITAVVFAVAVGGLWFTTQWAAWRLGYPV